MRSLIVADAGPLIALAKIEQLSLLTALFAEIHIPAHVLHEATDNVALGGATAVYDFAQIHAHVDEDRSDELVQRLRIEIDEGEAQAVALAKYLGCGVLMDDLLGREVAKRLGIAVVGVPGILLLAKREGLIERVQPCLAALTHVKYHLSRSLVAEVLRLAAE